MQHYSFVQSKSVSCNLVILEIAAYPSINTLNTTSVNKDHPPTGTNTEDDEHRVVVQVQYVLTGICLTDNLLATDALDVFDADA